MIVRYKKQALRDIERIHDYIAEFDPGAAKRVVERIGHSIGRLNVLPLSGRPGVVKGTSVGGTRSSVHHCSSCAGRAGRHHCGAPYGATAKKLKVKRENLQCGRRSSCCSRMSRIRHRAAVRPLGHRFAALLRLDQGRSAGRHGEFREPRIRDLHVRQDVQGGSRALHRRPLLRRRAASDLAGDERRPSRGEMGR